MALILTAPSNWLRRYETAAQKHPLATKAATCFVGFSMGDVIAQSLARPVRVPITIDGITMRSDGLRDYFDLDIGRTLRMGLFGALIAAPQMHIVFGWLEKVVMPRNPAHPVAVLSKVAIDQTLNSPLGTLLFFSWTQTWRGTPHMIRSEVEDKLWPVTRTGWSLWPAAQAVNFLLIPVQFRIIFINVVAIVWTCILSNVGNKMN